MKTNPTLWKEIDGFFDFEEVYRTIVQNCVDGDVVVEIGGYLGKSTCFLGNSISCSGKHIRVICVDVWPSTYYESTALLAKDPFEIWWANIRQSGWDEFIFPLRTTSQVASTLVRSNLAAVYIDGDHRFEFVKQDISAWLPKVRPGGILAGHDYGKNWPDVEKAVKAAFGDRFEVVSNQTWLHKIL
jgi:predicted O-methyltransferase YrrM